jgi:hypothetical protein
MTDDPFSIVTPVPILTLCFIVQLSPHQHASPILVLPPTIVPEANTQLRPIWTLCAMCTNASIFAPLPIIVSDNEPLAMEQLVDTSTSAPILPPPYMRKSFKFEIVFNPFVRKAICSNYYTGLNSTISPDRSILFNSNSIT